MSKIATVFSFFALTFCSLNASHYEITGNYSVKGVGEAGAPYSGHLKITESEGIYTFQWQYKENGEHDYGTGIIVDDVISIAFQELNPARLSGVQSFKIEKKGSKLSGPWIYFGGQSTGFETVKRVCD